MRFNGDVRFRHRKAHVGVVQHHAGVTRQRVLDTLREADAPHVKGHALRHFRLVHVHRQFGALRDTFHLRLAVDLAALDGNGVGLGLVVGVRGGIRVNGVRGILLIVCLQRHCTVRHSKSQRVCFQLFFAQTQSALFHRPLGEVITGLCLGCHFDLCLGFKLASGFGFIVANVAAVNGQGVSRRCLVLVGCFCGGIAGDRHLNGRIGLLTAVYQRQTMQHPLVKFLAFCGILSRQLDCCSGFVISADLVFISANVAAVHRQRVFRGLRVGCGQGNIFCGHIKCDTFAAQINVSATIGKRHAVADLPAREIVSRLFSGSQIHQLVDDNASIRHVAYRALNVILHGQRNRFVKNNIFIRHSKRNRRCT